MGPSAPTLPEAINSPDSAGGGPQAIRKLWERGALLITSDIHPLHPLELNTSHFMFFLYFSGVNILLPQLGCELWKGPCFLLRCRPWTVSRTRHFRARGSPGAKGRAPYWELGNVHSLPRPATNWLTWASSLPSSVK